ncbi:MTOR-associated protein MEAK7 isoform X2 [Ambystoma mexicanum]
MAVRIYNAVRSVDVEDKASAASENITKEQLTAFVSDLYRGNVDERGDAILRLIAENAQVQGSQVRQFAEELIIALVHILQFKKLMNGWSSKTTREAITGGKVLAAHFLSELKPSDRHLLTGPEVLEYSFEKAEIGNWIYRVPLVSAFLMAVISHGLSIMYPEGDIHKGLGNLVPRCKGTKRAPCNTVLGLVPVIYINSHLPNECQHRWRLLFATWAHGESFSQLCAQIVYQGPTLLVVKDTEGHLFGGFASASWEMKPQFQGDTRCFLFTILPHVEVFMYSGFNNHYMYLNSGQQTMPNGLGMGGQHDYFGLWIDSNFGKGHSKAKPKCTTYNSPQLSGSETFSIDVLEVWAVGDPPDQEERAKRSILDSDPEARALLEMSGRVRHSEGLRQKSRDVEEEEDLG